jgi:hypothetical protein
MKLKSAALAACNKASSTVAFSIETLTRFSSASGSVGLDDGDRAGCAHNGKANHDKAEQNIQPNLFTAIPPAYL